MKLLLIHQVAELLQTSEKSVQRLIRRNELKACNIGSSWVKKRLRIREIDLENFLASREIVSPTKRRRPRVKAKADSNYIKFFEE